MNENIITYIKENYIKSKMEPQFAVLVKGDWGCGKTFLVKKILEEVYGAKYKDKVIWLSVFGLSSIQQLRQKLFETIHPILTSKVAKFMFATVKAGLKASTSLDFNNDQKDDLSFDLAIPDLEKDENGNEAKIKKLLIVDDIERCSIPISELFGFFSEEILDRKVRAIFISNDEKIKELQKAKNNNNDEDIKNDILNDYKSIKEKIIGMEFEVQPNISEAVKDFIKRIGLERNEKMLAEKSEQVLKNLDYKNLRSVRQAFVHINQILNVLEEGNLEKKNIDAEYIADVIEFFLVLFIQKSNGEIETESQFLDAIEAYAKEKRSLKKYLEYHQDEKTPLYRWTKIPLQTIYFNIIQKGDFSSQHILEDYRIWTTPNNDKTPYQELIDNWIDLSDEDFKLYYNSVENDFKENRINNQPQIVRWAEFKFELSKNGIISETIEEIKHETLDYISENKDKLQIYESLMPLISITHSTTGTEALNQIIEELQRTNKEFLKCKKVLCFVNLYSNLPKTISELIRFIAYNEDNSFDVPILSLIDMNKFYNKIKDCTYEYQGAIYQAFAERYGEQYSDKLKSLYYPDIEKVNELSELYAGDISCLFMSPENVKKKKLSDFYKKLHNDMKSFVI